MTALVLGACTPRLTTHGYVPDPDALQRIEPGVHNELEVAQFLGTPSTTALFGQSTWLYITERTEAYAFLEPEVVDQRVVAIAFNDAGVVSEVDEYVLGRRLPGRSSNPANTNIWQAAWPAGTAPGQHVGRFAGQDEAPRRSPIPGVLIGSTALSSTIRKTPRCLAKHRGVFFRPYVKDINIVSI